MGDYWCLHLCMQFHCPVVICISFLFLCHYVDGRTIFLWNIAWKENRNWGRRDTSSFLWTVCFSCHLLHHHWKFLKVASHLFPANMSGCAVCLCIVFCPVLPCCLISCTSWGDGDGDARGDDRHDDATHAHPAVPAAFFRARRHPITRATAASIKMSLAPRVRLLGSVKHKEVGFVLAYGSIGFENGIGRGFTGHNGCVVGVSLAIVEIPWFWRRFMIGK